MASITGGNDVFGPAAQFRRAVARSTWDDAEAMLPRLAGVFDDALRRSVAALHAARKRWADAAAMLDDLVRPDAQSKLRQNLYRNLLAMKSRRPEAYRRVAEIETNDAYRVQALADGTHTVAAIDASGLATPLCPDPAQQVRQATDQLAPYTARGDAIAMLSIGDGHVLASLAANPPKLFLTRQQPIYLIEPDARLLHACLHLHDYTGPLGPIEQDRVLWFTGPTWRDALRLELTTDRFLAFPQVNVKQGGAAADAERALLDIFDELGRLDAAAAVAVSRHYAGLTAEDFSKALAGRAGRSARVMLVTTRQSTVLQHSTRDTQEAFRRLGFETALVIEPSDHHALTRSSIRRTLADFLPDLVFQIDHNRFEHGDLFPPNLPFVNWIQDLLPHLMTKATGAKLGAADFVLTPSRQRWVDDFAYPERQCLEFRKLTRVPAKPAARQVEDDRVVYVSNWSQSADQITAELIAPTAGTTRDVTAEACRRMTAIYDGGGTLASPGDVRRVLTGAMADLGATGDEAFVRQTTVQLSDRLNNLLYRQQGLAWAADTCTILGLKLEIYGAGWDAHPRFAPFARGRVEYGPSLEDLTRRAAVNLILEPFMCLAHQRLLDALAAGGFCLVHDHPANHTCNEWIDLLARVDDSVETVAGLRAALRDEDAVRFNANLAACDYLDAAPNRIDHVAAVRRLQHTGFFPMRGPVLPLLDAITFNGPADLFLRLQRATRDPVLRADVAAAQRRCVEDRFSYHVGMRRVVEFVVERLNVLKHGEAKRAA